MIYQGIIEFGQQPGIASRFWIIWLAFAVFGSALTLASFIKFIAGIYLGRRKENENKIGEVSAVQWIPQLVLALICILSGAFSANFVVKELFMPVSGEFSFTGMWDSSLLFWLVLASVVTGFLIYLTGSFKNMRRTEPFIGGEKAGDEHGFDVTGFYLTIRRSRFLSTVYDLAERKCFDIYELAKGLVLWTSKRFSTVHNGLLTTYAFWICGGLVVISLILIL
jgi:NADH:ubiquinone oxidoreductase subunit 5 (subunit L)/multisubunit Na+/H+ antiporter MnhA subunit